MRANVFVLNSDYDGPKEADDLTITLDIPAHVTPSSNVDEYSAIVSAPVGAYLVNASMSCNLFPGKSLGTTQFRCDYQYNDQPWNNWSLIALVSKQDPTHYMLRARFLAGGEQLQVPHTIVKAKVRLYTVNNGE